MKLVSQCTLSNPHGSDVTIMSALFRYRATLLSNPHGSDGTKVVKTLKKYEESLYNPHGSDGTLCNFNKGG